jgi:hypothetical protein
MASTINTITGASLTAIAQEALPCLSRKVKKLQQLAVWDLSAEAANAGAISTRIITAPSVVTFDATNGYQTVAQTMTAKTATLAHKHITVGFTDIEVSTTPTNLVQQYIGPMLSALADSCMTDINALVTNANFSTAGFTGAASTFSKAGALTLANKLTVKNAPDEDRYLLLNPDFYENLVDDLTWNVIGTGSVVETNIAPMVAGMSLISASSVAVTGENLAGWAGHKSAIIGVVRVPTVDADNVQTVVDPATGFPVQIRSFYDDTLGQTKIVATFLSGFAAGNNAISRIVTA